MTTEQQAQLRQAVKAFYKDIDAILTEGEGLKLRTSIKRKVTSTISAAVKPKATTSILFPSSLPIWWNDRVSEAWAGWCEMRAKKRVPMTQRAADLNLAEVCKLINENEDPATKAIALLDNATMRGWQKVFPIPQTNNTTNVNRQQQYRTSFQEAQQSGAFD